jgi:hypothetical protein
MPILKFHVPTHSVSQDALNGMAERIQQGCIELLKASPDAIQLMIMSPTVSLWGQQGYIEVLFRDQLYRQGESMQRFMLLLEVESLAVFGLKPRIRCIAVGEHLLHAKN